LLSKSGRIRMELYFFAAFTIFWSTMVEISGLEIICGQNICTIGTYEIVVDRPGGLGHEVMYGPYVPLRNLWKELGWSGARMVGACYDCVNREVERTWVRDDSYRANKGALWSSSSSTNWPTKAMSEEVSKWRPCGWPLMDCNFKEFHINASEEISMNYGSTGIVHRRSGVKTLNKTITSWIKGTRICWLSGLFDLRPRERGCCIIRASNEVGIRMDAGIGEVGEGMIREKEVILPCLWVKEINGEVFNQSVRGLYVIGGAALTVSEGRFGAAGEGPRVYTDTWVGENELWMLNTTGGWVSGSNTTGKALCLKNGNMFDMVSVDEDDSMAVVCGPPVTLRSYTNGRSSSTLKIGIGKLRNETEADFLEDIQSITLLREDNNGGCVDGGIISKERVCCACVKPISSMPCVAICDAFEDIRRGLTRSSTPTGTRTEGEIRPRTRTNTKIGHSGSDETKTVTGIYDGLLKVEDGEGMPHSTIAVIVVMTVMLAIAVTCAIWWLRDPEVRSGILRRLGFGKQAVGLEEELIGTGALE
jgi:hypothetical protein